MSAARQEPKSSENTFQVSFQEVVLQGKYNPALFIETSQLGKDGFCQAMINRGMDAADVRKLIHRDLIDGKSSRCSDIFQDRNMKSTEFKLSKLDTCSYCAKQQDQSKLWLYFTIVHVKDALSVEILKRNDEKTRDSCVFKHLTVASLETKIRDVRSPDPVIVNQDCFLVCLVRCDACMNATKVEVV